VCAYEPVELLPQQIERNNRAKVATTVKEAMRPSKFDRILQESRAAHRDFYQGSEWSAEDWTGLASQVESQV